MGKPFGVKWSDRPFSLSGNEVDWISACRGVAAISVLLTHTYYVFANKFVPGPDPILFTLGLGSESAVYTFFFLSGFLITLSIANNVRKAGSFDVARYSLSRVIRIYPPLIGTIILIFGVGEIIKLVGGPLNLPGREVYSAPASQIWTALALRSGLGIADGPLWSLYIEGQIYIIAGGVAMIGWSSTWYLRILGAIIVFVGYRLPQTNEWFNFYASIWLAGAAACVLMKGVQIILPPSPRWLSSTGNFSYSLYVIHFPILLLALSLKPSRFTAVQTGVYGVVTIFAILIFSRYFASIFENFSLRKFSRAASQSTQS